MLNALPYHINPTVKLGILINHGPGTPCAISGLNIPILGRYYEVADEAGAVVKVAERVWRALDVRTGDYDPDTGRTAQLSPYLLTTDKAVIIAELMRRASATTRGASVKLVEADGSVNTYTNRQTLSLKGARCQPIAYR